MTLIRTSAFLMAVLALGACTQIAQAPGSRADEVTTSVTSGLDASHLKTRDERQKAYRGIRYGRR